MNKKLLVISSTPRKGGNSDILCDQFIAGAKEAGHSAEKIFLADKKIAYCKGCMACMKTGVCIIKDDMSEILPKMAEADVIVLATPVYFYTMTAQLKTMIDRTVPQLADIKNKDFYFILSAGDTSHKNMHRTLESLRGFTEDCLENAKEKGIIYGTGATEVGDVKTLPVMQEAFTMGKNI
ncbi:multimeric flavodoxin WrbA [Elusimicrobium posterum]|uniref:flavodoxin family protein n=1 Tax=Elusimicrobium posterum TaxID=3116653 RepID=UPI003C73DCE4